MTHVHGTPGPRPTGASRAELVDAVAAALAPLPRGARAVVALSGGPDSTALAFLVAEARDDLVLTLAHVRHGLRDDAEDAAVVAGHADWLGLPLEVREVDVDPRGEGLEAAARRARYRALRDVAAAVGAETLLVGHTADDQAETVLLRLARGTGVDGLAGMRPHAGDVLRPLLDLRRADVHRFVLLEGLPSVQDPHNTDPGVRRSVARHEVLPALAGLAPDPVAALCRLADLAAADGAALEGLVDDLTTHVQHVGPVAAVRRELLARAPVAVARRLVRRLATDAHGGPPPDAAAVARVLALAPGGGLDLPGGVRATAGGGWLALAPPVVGPHPAGVLAPGGEVTWPPAARRLRWLGPDEAADGAVAADGQIALALTGAWSPPEVAVPAAALPPGGQRGAATLAVDDTVSRLWVRHRRPGDRLRRPAGRRRLQDLFVDAGVPRPVRGRWPVVVDQRDQVVWVPALAADVEVERRGRRRPAGLLVLEADDAAARRRDVT